MGRLTKTETSALPKSANAISSAPSPLKSAANIKFTLLLTLGTEYSICPLKVPSPLPNRMVTTSLLWLAKARSSFPSPLKSPTTADSVLRIEGI